MRCWLDAEVALARGGDAGDHVAGEILGNIAAMQQAVELATTMEQLVLDDLLTIHRTLMERSATPHLGGEVRTQQNWIGRSAFNPCSASFVPPPPDDVPALLDDLVAYVNGDDHSPLVQAALAHAQFETIHPFVDGNGRTGRALIHVVLRRRGLAPTFVPPIWLKVPKAHETGDVGASPRSEHKADGEDSQPLRRRHRPPPAVSRALRR